MFEEANGLSMGEVVDHEAENIDDGVESFISMTYIREANLIEQNLLHDENRDRLRQLGTMLHDPQAERNNLRREEKVDDLSIVGLVDRLTPCGLDEGTNNSQGRQSQVLERPRL